MGRDRVCLGVVAGPHGVRGLVKIRSFTADPLDIAAYGSLEDQSGGRRFELAPKGVVKGLVLVEIKGVGDRDAALALKGTELFVERGALPVTAEDTFYHADLIGLEAETDDGEKLGSVKAVFDHGAGVYLEIGREQGGVLLVPFTQQAVPVVEPSAGRLVVVPPVDVGGGKGDR